MRLIEEIVSWDNLVEANRLASEKIGPDDEVASFESNLWENLGRLQMELLWGSYRPSAGLPAYRDIVAFCAIANVIFGGCLT